MRNLRVNRLLYAYPSMLVPHVFVDPLALRESPQTHPTDMCLTLGASHVIAPLAPLDGNLAAWTIFDAMFLRPFIEEVFPVTLAFSSIVTLDMALGADTDQARRALQNSISRRRAIDLRTIRSRAVVKLIWTSTDINQE
jgi:hypothetical protein